MHTFHGHVLSGYFDTRRERVFRLVERALARTTDRIIAVSEQVRDDLVRFRVAPPEKIAVIHYGFDLDARVGAAAASARRQARRARHRGRVRDRLGRPAVGDQAPARSRPRRGSSLPDAVLVIAGDGELRADVEQLAASLGVADRVHILGYVDDIGAWYGAFDAFLLTSANEGAPVVAIEALAAGLPVVATDAGGTRTVVDDGETGYSRPIGDVERSRAALRELRDDPELRAELGAAGARSDARALLDRSAWSTTSTRLYAEILAR